MATIIFKPTEKCNSNCIYCDVKSKPHHADYDPYDLTKLVILKVKDYLYQHPEERVELCWHGGEPLLLGSAFFTQVADLVDQHSEELGGRMVQTMQTNLTLFNKDFVEPLKRLGLTSLGSSYEPLPNVRGPGEDVDSQKYNHMFMMAARAAEEYDIHWGFIYVVTQMSLKSPVELFYFLTNFSQKGGFNFNPVLIYDDARNYLAISAEEYRDFLGTIFPLWWKHRHRFPSVEPFRSLTKIYVEKSLHLGCGDSGQCAYSHVYIGPDGRASHCGRSADWDILDYGNIYEQSLEEIMLSQRRKQLLDRDTFLCTGPCQGCRFWIICHGGCPLDPMVRQKDLMQKTEWCEAKRGFLEKYFEPITGMKFNPHDYHRCQ